MMLCKSMRHVYSSLRHVYNHGATSDGVGGGGSAQWRTQCPPPPMQQTLSQFGDRSKGFERSAIDRLIVRILGGISLRISEELSRFCDPCILQSQNSFVWVSIRGLGFPLGSCVCCCCCGYEALERCSALKDRMSAC